MILNYGSINIDHVYQVRQIAAPGQTVSSEGYQIFAGGKGANQSMALARAGARVKHAGKIGEEGRWVLEKLAAAGVDISLTEIGEGAGGHAIIQVEAQGENSIVIHGGANREIDRVHIDAVFSEAKDCDWLLLQNEISNVDEIMQRASTAGMRIAFNPAPMQESVLEYPLDLVDLLVLNESEAKSLAENEDLDNAANIINERYRRTTSIVTLGAAGVLYFEAGEICRVSSPRVSAVDSTGAGDTFVGYLLTEYAGGKALGAAIKFAAAAAALSVTQAGAMDSIPARQQVKRFLEN